MNEVIGDVTDRGELARNLNARAIKGPRLLNRLPMRFRRTAAGKPEVVRTAAEAGTRIGRRVGLPPGCEALLRQHVMIAGGRSR